MTQQTQEFLQAFQQELSISEQAPMQVVINRDRRGVGVEAKQPPNAVNLCDLKHGIEHTFVHETVFNDKPPEFWKTNPDRLPCLYDHHPFDGPIFSIPLEYNHRLKKWTVSSIFCSPFCAKKYMLTSKDIYPRCYTLFSQMMKVVYNCTEDIQPASDISVLLYSDIGIEAWRKLPKEHVKMSLLIPEILPFVMQSRNLVSHVLSTHPAYNKLIKWNQMEAEADGIPDQSISIAGTTVVDDEEIEDNEDEDNEDNEDEEVMIA